MENEFVKKDIQKSFGGFDKIIKDSEIFDLSGSDILRITDNKTKILPYEALEHVSSLDEILNPFGSVVLLYQTSEKFGHWVALLDKGNHNLEFYDPYGLNVDEELNLDNDFHLRVHNGQLTPHLKSLINKDGWNVQYNKLKLQRMLKDVNTCGRYCALRVRFKDITMKKFNTLLTNNKYYHPDFWVSALTLLC